MVRNSRQTVPHKRRLDSLRKTVWIRVPPTKATRGTPNRKVDSRKDISDGNTVASRYETETVKLKVHKESLKQGSGEKNTANFDRKWRRGGYKKCCKKSFTKARPTLIFQNPYE